MWKSNNCSLGNTLVGDEGTFNLSSTETMGRDIYYIINSSHQPVKAFFIYTASSINSLAAYRSEKVGNSECPIR